MIQKRTGILKQWVPMPRYLLRRFVVRDLIRELKPRDFIEVGAGSGEMSKWMHDQNMSGTATELSPLALQMMQERLCETDITIHQGDVGQLGRECDLLLCMEVLEHVEDDDEMLRQFFQRIRPGGHVIISVPARQKLFAEDDRMVGHFRRYEKRDLCDQLRSTGFVSPKVLSYGFPLGWILRQIRIARAKRKLKTDARSTQQRTEASGVERDFLWLRCILNSFVFFPFHLIQLPFLRVDWSDGYVAVAQKPIQ